MKKAFTMIELVFILVVIGILAVTIIPSTRTNPVQEAAVGLISKIRYTQHLAMINDKYNEGADWYKNRWQIRFSDNKYSIVSNSNGTFAKDPQNVTKELKDIALKGLNSIVLKGTECADKTIISFDHLGRPMVGTLSATTAPYTASGNAGELLQTADCTIELSNGEETVTININPETGYLE